MDQKEGANLVVGRVGVENESVDEMLELLGDRLLAAARQRVEGWN